MRRRISSWALGALLLAPRVLPAQPVALPEVMLALASVKASRATFVETKTSSLLKAPIVLRGTLAYRRPDFLEKHVLSPYEERIALAGATFTVESGSGSATVRTSDSLVIAALVESMRAVRAGDLPALEKHFQVSVSGQREGWTMVLKPSREQLADYISVVTVSGTQSRITQLDVREPNGDRAVMHVREEVK